MKLRQHASSIVAIVLAIVAGVWIFVDRGKISDTERKDREHDVFPAYRRGDIDSLELVQGGQTLRIERRPDVVDGGEAHGGRSPGAETHWQLTSPVDERADPAAVDRFIGDLEFAGVVRKVDPTKAPDVNKGFDPPRVRGTLSMKPLVYHFALGGPAPLPEGAAYFRVDGEGTFVVSKDFVAAVLNGADTYRERTIVPYLSLDLSALEVHTATGTLGVTRVDDISFKLADSGLRASREGLDKVWGALAEARAESFLSDADADRALGPSPVRVVMTPKDKTRPPGELLLGGECPGHPEDVVMIRKAPTRESACVPRGALAGLSTPADALVDHRLFASRPDELEEVVLEAVPAGLTVELARKGRGWHQRKPSDRELSSSEIDAMNDLVTKLTRGEAITVSRATVPETPRARVRVRRGSSGVEEVVTLETGADRVRRGFDGAELQVPSALARRLVPSEIALRGRAVFESATGARAPTGLRIRCDDVHETLAHGAEWTMQEPRGYAADALATADVVALVRNAQADSWAADQDDGSFGLGTSTCSVELETASDGGKGTLGIVFGKEAESGAFYARATSDPAVFVAPRALREGVATWLIDRGAFRADPRAVESVALARGPSHVTFHGRGAGVDSGVRDTTARVLEALEVLRPEVVVHLGPPRPAEGFGAPSLDVRVKVVGDAGKASAREVHFVLGDTTVLNRERIVYARVDGVDATYGIARERVGALLDAL